MNHCSSLANKKFVSTNGNTTQKSSTSSCNIHNVQQFGDFSRFPRDGSNNGDSIISSSGSLHQNKQNTLKRYKDNTIDDYFKCKRSYSDDTRNKKPKIISISSTSSDEDDTICFSAVRAAKNREINKTSFNNGRKSNISNSRVFENDKIDSNDDLLAYITSQEENTEFLISLHNDASNIRQKHYIDHNKNIQLPPINTTHGTNYQKLLEDDLDFFESLTETNDNKFIDLLCSINRDCEKVTPTRVRNELPLDLFLQNFNSNQHHSQPVLCHKCGSQVDSNNTQKEYKFKYVREIKENNDESNKTIASKNKYQETDSGSITQNNFWSDLDFNRIKQQSEHSSSVLQTLGESNNRKDDFICLQSLAFARNEPGLLNYSISSSNSTNFTQMKTTQSSQVIENSISKTQDEIGLFHKRNSLFSTHSSSLFTTQETPNSSSQIIQKSSPILESNNNIEMSDLKVVNQSYDLYKYEPDEKASREVIQNSTLMSLESIADENLNKSILYSAQFSTKFDSSSLINIDLNKQEAKENLDTNKIHILQNVVLDNALINHHRNISAPNKSIQTLESRVLRDINASILNQDTPKAKHPILSSSNVKETQISTTTKFVENMPFDSKASCKSQKENDFQNDVNNLKEFLTEKMQDIGQYLLKNQNQDNARKIVSLLINNSTCTKRVNFRELYYQIKLKNFVKFQNEINKAIDLISCIIDEPPWDFGILAMQKGLVYGDLKITLSENEIINCNIPGGSLVPQDQRNITKLESDASFILIVEKDSVFQKLLDEDLPNRTATKTLYIFKAKGYLDISTRLFVKKLWQILKIPVFALVDADPCGIEIMLTYRFGSLALCHLSRYLALPSLRWIGIHPSEIISLNITREPLTKRDQNKIRSLLTRPYMHFVPKIKEELELMLKKDFKAQIEGVMKSENYMRNFYIPSKLCAQDFI
ncbi:meiotic recombination protein spo11 [Holotrichia oblita]|uniref:Meiotic recombination protein spo11 n=1 Tax=Holotrichia oblita TaxID=644536 RepID=A0ACB9TDG0_HOLOL|nr:meiotic recombination protein spo11 [Holotrichia oblita]